MLKEGLLAEGGGLDANALAQLNAINDANSSSNKDPTERRSLKKTLSRASDETMIQGLEEFNRYGNLFGDLTTRQYVETEHDVVNVVITYDSEHTVAIVNDHDEYFEVQIFSLITF